MTRRIIATSMLESELVTAACAATGDSAETVTKIIAPAVKHLQSEYGGGKLYIPKAGRKVSVDDIRRDQANHMSQTAICKKHHICHRTLSALIEKAAV